MRRILIFLVKVVISALLLYLSLRRINLEPVAERLGALDLKWVALILSLMCVQLPLLALRWREIAVICGAKLPPVMALRYTLIGQFFSQVLPSTAGGDVVRVWLMARGGTGWQVATYSVLIDRVVGVSAMAVLVGLCLPWTFQLIHDPLARAVLMSIDFGTISAASVFLALGVQRPRILQRWWLTRHFVEASRLAWRLWLSTAGARVAALSFAIHLMSVAAAWGATMATRAQVNFVDVLFLVLPVLLIAMIPASIAGWGIRESAMMLAFSYAGLAESDGLIVSILYGAANLMVGAGGGIVWIASGYRWRSVKSIETDASAKDLI